MFFGNSNSSTDNFSSTSNIIGGITDGLGTSNSTSNSSKDNLFSFSNEDSNDDLYPKTERSHDYYSYNDNYNDSSNSRKIIEDLKEENERLKSELLEAKSVRQEYFRLFQENKYLIDKMHELELSYLNKLSNANQKIKTLQAQLEGATAASQQMQSNWIQVAERLPSASDTPSPSPPPSSSTQSSATQKPSQATTGTTAEPAQSSSTATIPTAIPPPPPTSSSSSTSVTFNERMKIVDDDSMSMSTEGEEDGDDDNNNNNDDERDSGDEYVNRHISEPGTPQTQRGSEFFSQEYDEAKKKIMRAMVRMQEVEKMREELRKTKSSLAELEFKHTSSQRASAGKIQENERLNTILEGQNTLIEILSAAKKALERSIASKDLELASLRSENAALARRIEDLQATISAAASSTAPNSSSEGPAAEGAGEGKESAEAAALRGELASEKRAAAQLKSEYDELNEECLRQEQEIRQLREDLEILGAKKESSERIACTLTKEFLAFRKTVEARCESSQQEASQAEAERNTLREENERLAARVQERSAEIARLRAENDGLREKAQEVSLAREGEIEAAEKERARLEAELDSLKHKCEMLQKLTESAIQKEEHSLQSHNNNNNNNTNTNTNHGNANVIQIESDTQPANSNSNSNGEKGEKGNESGEARHSSSVVFSVMLSGFKDTATKKRIMGELGKLGCSIVLDEKELSSVTHLVVPSLETRTLKVVSAALMGKWVVTERWAAACAAAGFCVREAAFGFRVSQSPIAGKRVFFSQDFARDANRLRSALAIIDVGRGSRVLTPKDADIFLAHDLSAESFNAAAASFVAYDWPGFIEMLLKGEDNNGGSLKRKGDESGDYSGAAGKKRKTTP